MSVKIIQSLHYSLLKAGSKVKAGFMTPTALPIGISVTAYIIETYTIVLTQPPAN
jgi:hypothetical protein